MRWVGLTLQQPDPDGEILFNKDEAKIERVGAGFAVVSNENGRQKWFPDARVSMATWELEDGE